jgi:hypothetical protein
MQRADINDDVEGWHRYVFGELLNNRFDMLEDRIRWCKLHVSDGKFDYGSRWGKIVFYFEQLEDELMFRLAWA